MPRPKKIKPIKRAIDFDMNIPEAVGRSGDREMAKKILRQLLESQASGVNSGSKTGSFVEGRDYPEIALYQDSEGFVARPITSEPANYKSGGMYAKKKYDNGGKVTGVRTNRRGGSKKDYLRGAQVAMDYIGGLRAMNKRAAEAPGIYEGKRSTGGQKEAIDQALRYQEEFGLYGIDPDRDFSQGSTPTAFESGLNDFFRLAAEGRDDFEFTDLEGRRNKGGDPFGIDASQDTRLTPIQVEEILMSLPKKELKYGKGGTLKYRSGGMMKYENGGEISREPKVDIIDNKVLVGGSMIKKQKPGGGFEYVPKPEYANEAMFYVDGVPATFADAKFAYEQTSDAGVGLDFNDYIEKYTKQRGAYDLDLKKQRESLGERAESAGTPALLRALRDMQ